MHVFFDTEFTGLTSDPRPLSIGLLAANGATLTSNSPMAGRNLPVPTGSGSTFCRPSGKANS
jgi:hypothetical protein